MKNILILSHGFPPDIGGIETIAEILAIEFAKKGYNVRVVTTTPSSGEHHYPFEVIRNPGFIKLLQCHLWADIVFENNPCLRLSLPALFLLKPTTVVLHTWIARTTGNMAFIDRFKKLKLKTARSVIAVSKAIKEGSYPKAIVIPNPYKSDLFVNTNKGEREKSFVFMGRLVSDKGANMAIKAIARLKAENMGSYRLTIIGDGPEKDNLAKLTMALGLKGQVSFRGSLTGPELVNELCRHKYMLVPSKWREPFGIVALEGIACGCIPLVADGGGLTEAVGEAGLVFDRNNLDDLVGKIKYLWSHPDTEKQLVTAGEEHIKNYLPGIIADRYLHELCRV